MLIVTIWRLFNYSKEALKTKLTGECFYKDTAGHMDNATPLAYANHGLKNRYDLTKTSKSAEMMGGLHLDIMHMPRYLLNNVTLRIRMTRSKNEFCLMSSTANADYKVVLQDVCLDVRRICVAPSVINSHAAVLLRGKSAKYPLRRTDVLSFSVS